MLNYNFILNGQESKPFKSNLKAQVTKNETNYGNCKICNDKASGIHYGLASCEGCKGFFKRTIDRNPNYKCLNNQKCIINKITRNRCRHCRFEKCIRFGMSIDCIRMGRIPKNEKNKIVPELESYKEQSLMIQFDTETFEQVHKQKLDLLRLNNKLVMHKYMQEIYTKIEPYELFNEIDLHNNNMNLSNKIELIKITLTRNEVFQLYKNHIKYCSLRNNTIERIRKNNFKPTTSELPKFDEILNETGEAIAWYIKWLSEYINKLPSFNVFKENDLRNFISWGYFSSSIPHFTDFFSLNECYVITPNGYQMSRKFVSKIFGEYNTDIIFIAQSKLKLLSLTENETSLLYPFLLCYVDDNKIIEKESLHNLRDLYAKMLVYEFKLSNRNESFYKQFKEILEIILAWDNEKELDEEK